MGEKTLAWHETLELHELTAFKSIGLMKAKMGMKQIQDKRLLDIYKKAIHDLETSLKELVQFYPYTPKPGHSSEYRADNGFYAGDLLAFSKAEVRNYSVAITETATPMLKDMLTKQLNTAIKCHTRIFNYMYENGLYPSYDMEKLLQGDVNLANKALSM
ncbi:spore coat protein [Bacillus fonticola]|uniref:spore coat protein n=1 Tax=Bacillus fonticola TaxID=2728853 RepID=UPI0014734873|nr:spore coat protein [Bacillus fonticola]